MAKMVKMESNNITGGCLCGAVRYEISAKPLFTRACWCKLCQKLASGNATVNQAFPKDAVVITGEVNDFVSIADSGNTMHRKFCPKCGVHLFSETDARPTILGVRTGSLDDKSGIKLDSIIWTSEAPAWADLNSDTPHFTHQPPP